MCLCWSSQIYPLRCSPKTETPPRASNTRSHQDSRYRIWNHISQWVLLVRYTTLFQQSFRFCCLLDLELTSTSWSARNPYSAFASWVNIAWTNRNRSFSLQICHRWRENSLVSSLCERYPMNAGISQQKAFIRSFHLLVAQLDDLTRELAARANRHCKSKNQQQQQQIKNTYTKKLRLIAQKQAWVWFCWWENSPKFIGLLSSSPLPSPLLYRRIIKRM